MGLTQSALSDRAGCPPRLARLTPAQLGPFSCTQHPPRLSSMAPNALELQAWLWNMLLTWLTPWASSSHKLTQKPHRGPQLWKGLSSTPTPRPDPRLPLCYSSSLQQAHIRAHSARAEATGSEQRAWAQIPALPQPGITLGMSVSHSVPQFPHKS